MRHGIALEIFDWQINAAAFEVLADVTQDVGELEGDAGFFRQLFGAWVAVAEDADTDESNDGGYEIAVAVEIVEGCVGVVLHAPAARGAVKIHRRALDELIEKLGGYLEALLRVCESDEYRVSG